MLVSAIIARTPRVPKKRMDFDVWRVKSRRKVLDSVDKSLYGSLRVGCARYGSWGLSALGPRRSNWVFCVKGRGCGAGLALGGRSGWKRLFRRDRWTVLESILC